MHLVKLVDIRLKKEETFGSVCDRVVALLQETGSVSDVRVSFFFRDWGPRKVSACERAIKRNDELLRFHFEYEDRAGGPYRIISNLDESWNIHNPNGEFGSVDLEVLLRVARGIPRSYPFCYSTLVFKGFPTAGDTEGPALPEPPRSGIYYSLFPDDPKEPFRFAAIVVHRCGVQGGGKRVSLTAQLPLAAAGAAPATSTELSAAARAELDVLGRSASESVKVVLTPGEEAFFADAKRRADSAVESCRENMAELAQRIPFLHRLPDLKHAMRQLDPANPPRGSKKSAIVEVFGPLHLKYLPKRSRKDLYRVGRTTPLGNSLLVGLDVGGWGTWVQCALYIAGPNWTAGLPLPLCHDPETAERGYPILDMAEWTKIVENCAVAVGYFADSFTQEIEAIYGEAPVWHGV